MKKLKPILLVEDDQVDAMIVERALRDIESTSPLYRVGNGEEALEFLRNDDNARPAIILLDLNMPRMNGIEFLQIAKQDPELRKIPVVVLTTSAEVQDRVASFNLSVAGYMIKPLHYPQFVEKLRAINAYWSLSEVP